MDLLREKALSTRVLILLEIATGRHSRLASIAEQIGITKQAVSDYIKKMRDDDLVRVVDGEYRATVQGIQFMHRHLLDLKQFLDDTLAKLNIVESDTALAGNAIARGDTLGLFMEDGVLTADESLEDAYTVALMVEYCARIHHQARAIGEPEILPDEEIDRLSRKIDDYGQ